MALLERVFTGSNEPLFEAFDYLVDDSPVRTLPIPDPTWFLALDQADAESAELFMVGLAAAQAGKPTTAETAWRRAADEGDLGVAPLAAYNLGVLLAEQGDLRGGPGRLGGRGSADTARLARAACSPEQPGVWAERALRAQRGPGRSGSGHQCLPASRSGHPVRLARAAEVPEQPGGWAEQALRAPRGAGRPGAGYPGSRRGGGGHPVRLAQAAEVPEQPGGWARASATRSSGSWPTWSGLSGLTKRRWRTTPSGSPERPDT